MEKDEYESHRGKEENAVINHNGEGEERKNFHGIRKEALKKEKCAGVRYFVRRVRYFVCVFADRRLETLFFFVLLSYITISWVFFIIYFFMINERKRIFFLYCT